MTDKYSTKFIENKPSYNSYSQNKGMNFYTRNIKAINTNKNVY